MTPFSIAALWDAYATKIYGKDKISKTQYDETKKAFFAGAASTLALLKSLSNSTIPEEKAAEFLFQCADECTEFFADLIRRHVEGN